MLISYLDQLDIAARQAGIKLADACKFAGLPHTTLMRWRKGLAGPSELTSRKVFKAISDMAGSRDRAA